MIGETVSHYKILEKLGEGPLGAVYKAQDVNLERLVVLKFLHPELARNEADKARFLREAKAASALDHRNICTFYGLEQTERHLFIAMAYYDGETLREKMKKGAMPLEQVTSLVSQIAEGLAEVHKKGIVHRNMKPENIFVTTDGTAKILDFGLAKLGASSGMTMAGRTLGSPTYMSPEQLRGEKVDHRTDIWSLGVLAYAMITGRRPFEAEYAEALVYHITQSDPALMSQWRPDVPAKWEQIVRKALCKNVYERYQQVNDLRKDLRALRAEPSSAGAPAAKQAPLEVGVTLEQPKLGMAHVLFMDVVAYSTMMMDQQAEIIANLTKLVQGTEQYKRSKAAERLILLPTGDGMALVFFDDLMAPVECGVQIARALKAGEDLRLRMGVHSGPVYRTVDINQARNVAGSGINLAQRVMDCGDQGHILVSKSYADMLAQLSEWREYVHELGVAEVKHGVPVHLYNLYGSDFGNPERPKKMRPKDQLEATQRKVPEKPPAAEIEEAPRGRGLLLAAIVAAVGIWGFLYWKPLYCKFAPSAAACLADLSITSGPRPRPAPKEEGFASGALRIFLSIGAGAMVLLALARFLMARGGAPPREAYIEVVEGPLEGKRFLIDKNLMRLGAASKGDGGYQNDLVLPDKDRLISRFHCEIQRKGNRFFVVDPGSANGTFVEGRRLDPGKPFHLRPGLGVDLAHRYIIRVGVERSKR